MTLFIGTSFILSFISRTSVQTSKQIWAYTRYVVIGLWFINQYRSINFIQLQLFIPAKMNNMKVALLLMFLVVVMSTMHIAAHEHIAVGQCYCQRGEERGGHCHCPGWAPMLGVYCRYILYHWVCFPYQNWNAFTLLYQSFILQWTTVFSTLLSFKKKRSWSNMLFIINKKRKRTIISLK
jgi:hypothetical protein